jgi:serine/threonine-protein kinase
MGYDDLAMRDTAATRAGPVPPSSEVDVGATLGSYELVGLLGAGAMGRVYRGRHVLLGREVAVKVLNPEFVARPDIVQRFFREARVVNDIDHEHIVEVTDFVEAPGIAYLVMELLDGASLRALMKARGRRYLPLRRIVAIVSQVCEALAAAHEKGVVHRDLKPDNVFVVDRGGEDFVKVLDFGVAKLHDTVDKHETSAGAILGTPHYMSPEQALGREVDRHADVWAAGVVLYELLSGAVPFTARSFVELATHIREDAPKPLPRKTPRGERIPPALAAAVMRCLEKKPSDRFRSMTALADALRAPVPRPRARRRRGRAIATAAVVALLAGGAYAAHRQGLARRVEKAVAPAERAARALVAEVREAVVPEPPRPRDPASPTPAPPRATSAPAPPRPQPAPVTPRPARVDLRVRTTPPGAAVVRLDTRERLGKTPLDVQVPRSKAARVWIEVRHDGYAPVRFAVDLREDAAANVTLRRLAKKPARKRVAGR